MPISKDNTAEFFKKVEQAASSGLKRATALVERDAKILSPVLTGTLKRSITHEFIGEHTTIVGSNVEYAPHVELGTSKSAAQPFLRPALHKNLKEIRKLLE